MSLDSMDRADRYTSQNRSETLTAKQRRRVKQKDLAGHVECREGREYDGSPIGRCVVCGRDEDNFLPGPATDHETRTR